MPSERIQRRIDQYLDAADAAAAELDWVRVGENALAAQSLDPENEDARVLLAAAQRRLADGAVTPPAYSVAPILPAPTPDPAHPTAFVGGRYTVTRFLGEGGKKRVYLAHDTLLDRDVAFALIKTEGLDGAGRARFLREAQAMGRLGAHPHIVTIYEAGEEHGQPYLVTELMAGGDLAANLDAARSAGSPRRGTLQRVAGRSAARLLQPI